MANQPMYAAVNNSIPTTLAVAATTAAATLTVAGTQTLPAGPNLVTVGEGDEAELVFYTGRDGTKLTGCVRGFHGTAARIWPVGTAVYRAFTAYDHDAFKGNIEGLAEGKLDKAGDASQAVVAFTQATGQAQNIATGERLQVVFGKLARWFAQLGQAAWAGIGTGSGQVAAGNHTHAQYATLDANGKVAAVAASRRYITAPESRALTADDAGGWVQAGSLQPVVITIPNNAEAAMPVETEIVVSWEGEGKVTLQTAGGVVVRSKAGQHPSVIEMEKRYGAVLLKKKQANMWGMYGDYKSY